MKDLEIILKNIKNKEFLPIYFLHGEEPYFIDVLVKALEEDALNEEEKAFNQTIVYGKDTEYGEILALAKQLPMMPERQLIIVKEAQELKLNEPEQEAFLKYIENPVSSTILVFAHKYKKLDSRKKVGISLKKNNFLFYSEPFKSYGNDLPNFIQSQCNALGFKTAPNISHLLAEYLGNDLSRITNELEKLKLVLTEGEILDAAVVERNIGISKDYNVFELQDALGIKDKAKSMKIAHFMGKDIKSGDYIMVIGNLTNFFTNFILIHSMAGMPVAAIAKELGGLPPFVVQKLIEKSRFYPLKHTTKILSVLREYDLKGKGLGVHQTEHSQLLNELIYTILHIDQIK